MTEDFSDEDDPRPQLSGRGVGTRLVWRMNSGYWDMRLIDVSSRITIACVTSEKSYLHNKYEAMFYFQDGPQDEQWMSEKFDRFADAVQWCEALGRLNYA